MKVRAGHRTMKAHRGNALMEYAVPAAVILLSAGVLVTVTDATDVMAEYYLAASGRTTSSLQGTTFKTEGLAQDSYGDAGNGLSGFSNFATVKDGSGGAVATSGGGLFFSGDYTRSGGRQASPSTEYLYP